jgi:hypothetical protein
MDARQYRLLVMQRLDLREADLDRMEDDEFATAVAEALWLEEREVEVMAAALSRVFSRRG